MAALNLAYFVVEFTAGLRIGSVSLFADSIDFLEDASVNVLILFALGWSPHKRGRLGAVLSGLLLAPAIAGLWTAWQKVAHPLPPAPLPLSAIGGGALLVNLACALMLARYQQRAGHLTRAAFLSARNDVLANVGIIVAGGATAFTRSIWPDLVVGLAIALLNADAAREIYLAARNSGRAEPS